MWSASQLFSGEKKNNTASRCEGQNLMICPSYLGSDLRQSVRPLLLRGTFLLKWGDHNWKIVTPLNFSDQLLGICVFECNLEFLCQLTWYLVVSTRDPYRGEPAGVHSPESQTQGSVCLSRCFFVFVFVLVLTDPGVKVHSKPRGQMGRHTLIHKHTHREVREVGECIEREEGRGRRGGGGKEGGKERRGHGPTTPLLWSREISK